MSVLPQLTFSRGCQLPPAAPSSLFEPEEHPSSSCAGAVTAPVCSGNGVGHDKQSSSNSKKSRPSNAKSRGAAAAAELRGMKAAEETLQWLAARVLEQTPPPHMLPLSEVFDEILRLDAAAASHALLQITRNVAKVLQASRFLFVGNRAACEHCLAQRLEEEKQREVSREQQQQQEAHERQAEERDWQQHKKDENEDDDKRWDGEETVAASWEQHVDAERKEKSENDVEDICDWSCVPVRDEQSSCFPWLMPNAAVVATAAKAAEASGQSSSAGFKNSGELDSGYDSAAPDGDAAVDHLFVLLQPISPAEEAFGCPDVLIKLCNFLSVRDVISVGRVCRATVAAALSEDVWMPLLHRAFPKASLVNEDVLGNAEEQQRIDQEKHKQIVDDMLVRIPPDKPVRLAELLLSANKTLADEAEATTAAHREAIRVRMDAEALLHLISCHPDTFKQDATGQQFVVQPSRLYSDWLPVNPYAVADWGLERMRHLQQEMQQLWREEQCEAGAIDLTEEKQQQERQRQPPEHHIAENAQKDPATPNVVFRRDLSARQAYRLWHTKLLGAEQNRERPWEYFNACSEISSATKSLVHKRGLLLPAGALLDLCERRLRFVRLEDPMTVHTLVLRTIDGIMYHIPVGCFNRRVNLLQQALCSPHLRLERETRKRIERRLLDFMQHVREERKFGYFACRSCGSRWRSGFTYDEIAQQCVRCGMWNKAFKCQPLLSGQDLNNALQKNPVGPLQQQQHHSGTLQRQQHQVGSSTLQPQHDVRNLMQKNQQSVRNIDPQIQRQTGRQQQQQHQQQQQQQYGSGGRRQEDQRRPRQQLQQQQPSAAQSTEPSQPSSGLLENPHQSGDAPRQQSCATTEQGHRRRQSCTEQSNAQQARFSSSQYGQLLPQQPLGVTAQSRQQRQGGIARRRTRVDEQVSIHVDFGNDGGRQRPLPNADQDRQQTQHIEEQAPHRKGEDIQQQRNRPTRDQQDIYERESRQGVRSTREPGQTRRGAQREALIRSQPHVPSDSQQRQTPPLLSNRDIRCTQATPETMGNGRLYAEEAAGHPSVRRSLAEGGQRQEFHWEGELQPPERRQVEKDCFHRPLSQGALLLQGLQQQQRGRRDMQQQQQQYQSQSQMPSRRTVGRAIEDRFVRENRRDVVVPRASNTHYDSRSEIATRVVQQQLRAAAREERL